MSFAFATKTSLLLICSETAARPNTSVRDLDNWYNGWLAFNLPTLLLPVIDYVWKHQLWPFVKNLTEWLCFDRE